MSLTRPRITPALAPVSPTEGALRPLGLDEVRITGGFWGERLRVNARATLPHIHHWLEREGWLRNFDLSVDGGLPEGRRGREFSDSEVYKFLEAVAWQLGREDDAALAAVYADVVSRVVRAQEPDGYLGTNFGRPGQAPRWSDLEWGHELYCLGHLFQAAVAAARIQPTGGDALLEAACRAADLVCSVFADDGLARVCGHPEIEVGLAELGRAVGRPEYVAQAARFVDRRGHGVLADIEWGRSYFQDDVPVRDTEALHGHAVRANYLAAGAVDVAVEHGDRDLLDALRRQWAATVARRTYITGGQGAHHQDEAFGEDWELPPDRAYSETCAGIGSIMFSWRLMLATGEERYADLVERTLFNVVATSPDEQGTAFYYANTLHQRVEGAPADPDAASPRAKESLRAPWFTVSCCPPNVARTLASLPAYLASADDEGVQLHQYAQSSIRTVLPDGEVVALRVETDYPVSGTVRVHVEEDAGRPWTLRLRVPDWARGARVKESDGTGVRSRAVEPGVAAVRRRFRAGDVVELDLPMRGRITVPDDRIDAVRGCVAVERGPEVYCLESVDLPSAARLRGVDDVRLAAPVVRDVDQGVHVDLEVRSGADAPWPYSEGAPDGDRRWLFDVPLVPYHRWAQRGPSTMRVWLPLGARSSAEG